MSSPLGLTHPLQRNDVQAAQPDGDHNLGPYLNRVIWTLAALSGVFMSLRLIALVVSIALQTVATTYGLGRLYSYLSKEEVSIVTFYSITAGFHSILATCWSKTSFAISLLRISQGKVHNAVWFIIISTNLVLGSNGAIQWAQCWPVPKRWHSDMEGTSYSGVMDIVLAFLPWKIIWTVAINKKEKMGALLAMSTGVISGIMAFLKIKTVYVIGNGNVTEVDLFIFGTAEPATTIMAASIPCCAC
ncbi:hypothetical protein N0V88_005873 [Collariella sp. IMI 366227]|nr:hypothetical protein N0V88_005873 [Collariella sp. IMI 366227]